MPELLPPHFIWWSSASSLPLLLIRHGSSLSLPSLSHPPPFILCFQFCLNPNIAPSLCSSISRSLCTLLFTQPSLIFPLTHYIPIYLSNFSISGVYSCPPSVQLYTSHFTTPNSHCLPKKTQERSRVFLLYLHNEWLVVTPAPRQNTERVSGREEDPWWWWWRGVFKFKFSYPE